MNATPKLTIFHIVFSILIAFGLLYYAVGTRVSPPPVSGPVLNEAIPTVCWDGLGKKMTTAGVIDAQKFENLYAARGGLTPEEKELLYNNKSVNLAITSENSGFVLNMLWALGLSNKNPILDNGAMKNTPGVDVASFASTGGWTLGRGGAMDYYSKFSFVPLSPDEQALVERVAKNIYRPCCNNSTYFPDCNHGMAMLGLLELLASQGTSEAQIYRTALQVNAYWFPDTYYAIQKYFEKQNRPWASLDPKEILGADYSSASGYSRVLSVMGPVQVGGASCGV